MTLRVLLSLFAIAVAAVFGQNSASLKAGDFAPNLIWTRILQSPGDSGRDPGSFLGHLTVVGFFPMVSLNQQLVSQWNQLVAKFAGQPVQFVWICSEYQPPLDAWLQDHPVSGWLLLDPLHATAQTYGVEFGGMIVDTNGRIAGFTFMFPEEHQIKAVLEGKPAGLNAEPHRPPEPEGKPNIPPSYEVHISPSKEDGTVEGEAPDYWMIRGFDLKSIFAKVYEQDPSRVLLPDSLDGRERYDLVLVPPAEMERPAMRRLMQQALEKRFRVSTKVGSTPTDVYVMTALEGKTPKPKTGDEAMGGGSIGVSSQEWTLARPADGSEPTPEMIREALGSLSLVAMIASISADNTSMHDFRMALEEGLKRPIVDETKMEGTYDFETRGQAKSVDEFLQMAREQLGLVLTPARRNIDMFVVSAKP
jgi:uncharacterized protein (TIGR03435 family)